jgi:hypothetical protein
MSGKPPIKDRFKALMAEYGPLALGVYFTIFGIVLLGFALALDLGLDVGTPAGTAGLWATAYVATKLTQPLRILATLAVTPLLVGALRWKKKKHESFASSAKEVTDPQTGSTETGSRPI